MADNATLKSQYLAQVEADLERTTKERERIATDLAALQEQLATLEQDHALLVGVQQTLADGAASSAAQDTGPAGAPADVPPAAVPRARKPTTARRTTKPSAANGTATKTETKTESKTGTKAATKTATAAGTATGGSGSSGTPTLVELVMTDLTGHSEPRSASEITTALTQAHPGRKMQTTVVRNTLEALVAKGQTLRSKQGRSVYYSAVQAADTARAAKSADKNAATTA